MHEQRVMMTFLRLYNSESAGSSVSDERHGSLAYGFNEEIVAYFAVFVCFI